MRIIRFFLLLAAFTAITTAQENYEKIIISDDIYLLRVSPNCYVHTTIANMGNFGKVSCNGMIFMKNGEAFLFDTPANNEQTRHLVTWVQDSFKVRFIGFLPNHWHNDCMGGLEYLQSIGVPSYANELTIKIAREKDLPALESAFKDSLILQLDGDDILMWFPGAGHALDNTVAYIPSEKVLFGGCMVKELSAAGIGNISDADVKEWPYTIKKVMQHFRDAEVVVPGHGKPGGKELLARTLEIAGKSEQD